MDGTGPEQRGVGKTFHKTERRGKRKILVMRVTLLSVGERTEVEKKQL